MYNGGHTYWIWQVGTKHKYWVEGDLSNGLEGKLDWDHFYWGNFQVCPTTKFKRGYAQGICLTSIGKLTKSDRKE